MAFSVLALPLGAGMLAAGIIYVDPERGVPSDVSTIADPRKAKILIPIGTMLRFGPGTVSLSHRF